MTPYDTYQSIDTSIERIHNLCTEIHNDLSILKNESKILMATIIGCCFVTVMAMILIGYHIGNKIDALSDMVR